MLLKDLKRKSKFEPKYLPRLFEVIQVKQKGVVVRGKSGRKYKRHKDDVKRTKLEDQERVQELASTENEQVEEQVRNPMELEEQEQYEEFEASGSQRPSRKTRLPSRFNDFVMDR